MKERGADLLEDQPRTWHREMFVLLIIIILFQAWVTIVQLGFTVRVDTLSHGGHRKSTADLSLVFVEGAAGILHPKALEGVRLKES